MFNGFGKERKKWFEILKPVIAKRTMVCFEFYLFFTTSTNFIALRCDSENIKRGAGDGGWSSCWYRSHFSFSLHICKFSFKMHQSSECFVRLWLIQINFSSPLYALRWHAASQRLKQFHFTIMTHECTHNVFSCALSFDFVERSLPSFNFFLSIKDLQNKSIFMRLKLWNEIKREEKN